jgi:hypothetical protein
VVPRCGALAAHRINVGRQRGHLSDMSTKFYLVIDFEKEAYTGCLFFRDPSFCNQIARILRNHIGRPIKEIGDLDLSATL